MPVKAFILLFCVKYPISPLSTCKQFKYVVGIKCTIENIGAILVHPHVQANKNNNDEKKTRSSLFFNKTDNTKNHITDKQHRQYTHYYPTHYKISNRFIFTNSGCRIS